MRVRLDRLAFFQNWLLTHFAVNATFDSAGASAVGRWVDRYGDVLLGGQDRDRFEFPYHSKAWTKDNPGYSVIFDLGIFIGEFVIEKRPWCRWELTQETPDKPSINKSIAKLRPALFFHRKWDPMNPIGVAWHVLCEERAGMRIARAGKGALVEWIKQFMYNARVPYDKTLGTFSLRDVDRESFDRMVMIDPD